MIDGLGRDREVDVAFADAADAEYTICTFTSSVLSFSSDWASASCEPCTSALMMSRSICASPGHMSLNMFSSFAACFLASLMSRNLPGGRSRFRARGVRRPSP